MNYCKSILYLFTLLFFFSCNFSSSDKRKSKSREPLEELSKYDSLVFKLESLDTLSLEDRIQLFENQNRIIFYFDENWKIIEKEEASYVSTITHLEKDLFYVRDYYINGENQMNGVYKALKKDVDWSKINEWGRKDSEARKIGMCVWFRNKRIDFTEYYEYSDFEKGYGSSQRKEYEYPPKSKPVKVLIKKDKKE